MVIELARMIEQVLGALATVTESIEKAVMSSIRTVEAVSSGLEKRRIRRIADALAPFYFTPVGIRKDLEIYINNPSHDNLVILELKLKDNHEIILKFKQVVYEDLDSKLFRLPMSNIDYLFDVKSELWCAINNFRHERERLSVTQMQEFLDEMKMSFEKFNQKLEETIKVLCDIADQVGNGEKAR